jgi:hypothetical protein
VPNYQTEIGGLLARRSAMSILPGNDFQECKCWQTNDRDLDVCREQHPSRGRNGLSEAKYIHDDFTCRRPCDVPVIRFDTAERNQIDDHLVAMAESMLLSLNTLKRAGFEHPLSHGMELILAANCERKIDMLCESLYWNLCAVVQMQIAGEGADHDGRTVDGPERGRHACGDFCMQAQFTSL